MLNDDWAVFVCDANHDQVAQLDDLRSFECVERHLGLGTWRLEAHFAAAGVDELVRTPGASIEVRDPFNRLVFAGPLQLWRREHTVDDDRFTAQGWDWTTVLHTRLVHPEPLTATPPFSTSSHDTHTGPASTVLWQFINRNAGPGALIDRRWPELTMAADPAEGASITVAGRWQNLLEHVAAVAAPAGMSVLARRDEAALVATVRAGRDRSNVELSPRAGTLQSWVQEWTAPEMTAGWAGGQGDLTARTVVQDSVTPPAEWPWRFERFVDYTNAEPAELDRKLDDALTEGAAKTMLEVTPTEGEAARYGTDFDLGDLVTVVLDDVASTEPVTSFSLRLSADGGAVRSFTVGTDLAHGLAAVFALMRQHGARLRVQEGH